MSRLNVSVGIMSLQDSSLMYGFSLLSWECEHFVLGCNIDVTYSFILKCLKCVNFLDIPKFECHMFRLIVGYTEVSSCVLPTQSLAMDSSSVFPVSSGKVAIVVLYILGLSFMYSR